MELKLETKNEAVTAAEIVQPGYMQIAKDIYRSLMVDSAIIRQLERNINDKTADAVAASYVKEILRTSKDLMK